MGCVITGDCAFEGSIQRPRVGEVGLLVFQRRRAEGRIIKELGGCLALWRHVAMHCRFGVPAGSRMNSQA